MKKKTPSQATSPTHNSKSPEIELMIHQIIDKRISDNEGNIKWLADKALKNLDLRISIYSAVIASAVVITAALSSWLGWPQLVNAIMKQIGRIYVSGKQNREHIVIRWIDNHAPDISVASKVRHNIFRYVAPCHYKVS